MSKFNDIHQAGTSVWFDFIRRDLLEDGGLAALVAEGIRGVTSNPSIFQKAIADSTEYDDDIRVALEAEPACTVNDLYESFAIEDIRAAADILRSVYDDSDGADGFVSLEVSPLLASDTDATVTEARRLWAAVDRPNLLIKVPATAEGVPAIETLIGEGINVNVTLIFSLEHYESIARAYIRGLETADDPSRIASVASFFVSRVDTLTDSRLTDIGSDQALALRGRAGIANSKLAYRLYEELFGPESFGHLAARGARPQRLLWASTGTKNPEYSDVLYVEELIGPNTVNTAPPATIDAFRDHGEVRGATLLEDWEAADADIAALASVGVDFEDVTATLQTEGVESFAAAFQSLMTTLKEKAGLVRAG
jgi:transaldolase